MDINAGTKDGSLGWTKIDAETRALILTLLARAAERGFREGAAYAMQKAELVGEDECRDWLGSLRNKALDEHAGDETKSALNVLLRRHPGALRNIGLDQSTEDFGEENNMR